MEPQTCTNCEEARQEASLPPQLMTYIGETSGKKGTKYPVFACPTCDGQRLIDLATRNV